VRAVFTAYLVFTIGVLAYFWVIGHSWFGHSFTGWSELNQEQLEHGDAAVSWTGYLGKPDFWEQSFQNWQSELLAIGAMVVFRLPQAAGLGGGDAGRRAASVTGESG
jgi:hypothetical protein